MRCTQLHLILRDPMDYSPPWDLLFTGFPRHEYWSGSPFPSAGDLPTQGSNLHLLHRQYILYH